MTRAVRCAAALLGSTAGTAHAADGEKDLREKVEECHRRLVADAFGTCADLSADDAVMEFPFAPPGLQAKVAGKKAIAEFFSAGVSTLVTFEKCSGHQYTQAAKPGVIFVEVTGAGTSLVNGSAFKQTYGLRLTVAGGQITHFKEDMNPLVVQQLTVKME
jgi:ketosteroid isomerase-like protein